MRLSPLLLVAGAGAVTSALASAHDQASAHHLEARDPFSLSHGGNSARVLGRGFPLGANSLHQSSSKNVACPRSFKCDGEPRFSIRFAFAPANASNAGSGTDGYQRDIYGNGPPSLVPNSGWAYFGVAIGWAPTASFDCSASFKLPSIFLDVCDQVTWWSPSAPWRNAHLSVDLGIDIPSFWNFPQASSSLHQSSSKNVACPRSFKCNGSGTDGYQLDMYGNGPPSWVPSSGWAYFGIAIGWAPTASFECSASFTLPSAFLEVADQVTWWCKAPPASSHNSFADKASSAAPSTAWKTAHLDVNVEVDLNFTIPSFWNLTPRPSSSWQCSGSGKDGWSVDISGNGPPSWVPASGWAYFGAGIGWAPIASFECSASFTLPSAFLKVADQKVFFPPASNARPNYISGAAPSAAWKNAHLSIYLGFDIPSFWNFTQAPSASWICDGALPFSRNSSATVDLSTNLRLLQQKGTGKDGWSVDISGNGPPSWVPASGWAYFGVGIGWAPTASFECSASFTLPSAFLEVVDQVTWWCKAHPAPSRDSFADKASSPAPSAAWKTAYLDVNVEVDLGFTIPSFWNLTPRPSSSWQCSGTPFAGSGKDGWSVDIYGNGPPSWVPTSGWAYFGQSVGWAPIAGWTCNSSWTIPSQWEGSSGKVTWWCKLLLSRSSFSRNQPPPTAWINKHKGHSFGWGAPSFWFGSSSSSSVVAVKATSSIAVVSTAHSTYAGSTAEASSARSTRKSYTAVHTATSVEATASSAKASSTIKKASSISSTHKVSTSTHAASTTSNKATTSSKKAPSSSTSHKPSTTHKVSTATAKSLTATHLASTTSHKASTTTKKPVSSSSSSHKTTATSLRVVTTSLKPTIVRASAATVTVTGSGTTEYFTVTVTQTGDSAAPSATKLPSKTWTSDGSGKDGWEVDWQGNGCPSYYPSGWLWFGTGVGWAPPSGWVNPSSWSPSSLEIMPATGWKLPSGVSCPPSWATAGWIDTRIPSASFQCDGSGIDGFDFDFEGNARPSGFEIGFKWFGKTEGWQPCAWFELPSAYWTAPAGWNARLGTWWKPTGIWYLKGEFECPKFWSKNFLRGSFLWW
ncbi:SPOSA6832_00795, partial [Sporobolomyces salmonicolor]